jgi:hypothetical protein
VLTVTTIPLLSNSDFLVPDRAVGLLGYRIEYGKKGYGAATSITLGYVGQRSGSFTYIVAGDLNGDRVNNNELIFVPNKGSDIKFAPLTVGTRVYTEAEQQAAFDKLIIKMIIYQLVEVNTQKEIFFLTLVTQI